MTKGKTGSIRMDNNFEKHSNELFLDTLKNAENESLDRLVYRSKHKKERIYFAGPWFDERSNKLYDTCYKICESFKENFEIYFPREEINETPRDAFYKNVQNIKDSDIVIALVSKKDVGTAWEIGMAYALNKEVYLLGYDNTTFLSHTNVMLAFTGKCFTIEKLGKFLQNDMRKDDYVLIKNLWEGIE